MQSDCLLQPCWYASTCVVLMRHGNLPLGWNTKMPSSSEVPLIFISPISPLLRFNRHYIDGFSFLWFLLPMQSYHLLIEIVMEELEAPPWAWHPPPLRQRLPLRSRWCSLCLWAMPTGALLWPQLSEGRLGDLGDLKLEVGNGKLKRKMGRNQGTNLIPSIFF